MKPHARARASRPSRACRYCFWNLGENVRAMGFQLRLLNNPELSGTVFRSAGIGAREGYLEDLKVSRARARLSHTAFSPLSHSLHTASRRRHSPSRLPHLLGSPSRLCARACTHHHASRVHTITLVRARARAHHHACRAHTITLVHTHHHASRVHAHHACSRSGAHTPSRLLCAHTPSRLSGAHHHLWAARPPCSRRSACQG